MLSVNSTNAAAAADWGCEVVVVPDVPDWEGVSERQPRRVMVPLDKKHVAEEVMRKL